MERGYVKFWRKAIDSGFLQNPNLFTFWSWCLLKASHKERKQMVGMELVKLNPGDFVFGRKSASIELKMSEQTIRTCLKKLKKLENLTTKVTNKFTIITIVNWDTYQDDEKKPTIKVTSSQPASNQQVTSSQPAANHKQECKHLNIRALDKKEIPPNPPGGKVSKKKEFQDYLIEKIKDTSFVKYQKELLDFIDYRMSLPARGRYKTVNGINGLLTCVGDLIRADLDPEICIPKAMEEEWLKPKPEYFLNNRNRRGGGKMIRSDENKKACASFIQKMMERDDFEE